MDVIKYKELFIDAITKCLFFDIGVTYLYKAFNAIKIQDLLDMLLKEVEKTNVTKQELMFKNAICELMLIYFGKMDTAINQLK